MKTSLVSPLLDYSYPFSVAQQTCRSTVLLNLSVSVLPEGRERWFGAHMYGYEF